MPTIYREGPYKFFFFANEGNEPPHVHIESGNGQAKFWLNSVQLAKSMGYNQKEIHAIQQIVEVHQHEFIAAWNNFFHKS